MTCTARQDEFKCKRLRGHRNWPDTQRAQATRQLDNSSSFLRTIAASAPLSSIAWPLHTRFCPCASQGHHVIIIPLPYAPGPKLRSSRKTTPDYCQLTPLCLCSLLPCTLPQSPLAPSRSSPTADPCSTFQTALAVPQFGLYLCLLDNPAAAPEAVRSIITQSTWPTCSTPGRCIGLRRGAHRIRCVRQMGREQDRAPPSTRLASQLPSFIRHV